MRVVSAAAVTAESAADITGVEGVNEEGSGPVGVRLFSKVAEGTPCRLGGQPHCQQPAGVELTTWQQQQQQRQTAQQRQSGHPP